ncbi:MAG TPA: heme-binding protein [Longimicrobiales bacterium]
MRILTGVLVVMLICVSRPASAQLPQKPVLTLEAARAMVAAGEAHARTNGWNVVIAIVDDGGHAIHLVRMDGTQTASVDVALAKARTAAGFRRPTRALAEIVAAGGLGILAVDGVMPLEGGLPVTVDGQVIGAIGVSGVTAQQDGQIAEAALAAIR